MNLNLYAQMAMPTANTLLANAELSDTQHESAEAKSVTNKPRVFTSISDLKKQDEKLQKMQEDFIKVTKMTLTDDEEYLYTLHMKSPAFADKSYLCNLLSNLYRSKYPEIFELYPGMVPWIIFCISYCLSKNEDQLKSLCVVEAVRLIKTSSASICNLITKRKRPINDASATANKRAKLVSVNNPFFKNPIYNEYKILFNIGECAKYSASTDFAPLFLTLVTSTVSRMNGNMKVREDGYRANFSKMIVASLQSRELQSQDNKYTAYNIAFVDELIYYISQMTKREIDFDNLNLGIKKNMLKYEILGKLDPQKIDGVQLNPDDHYFCLFGNFQGTINKDNHSISLRAYSSIRYDLPNRHFELKEEKEAAITEIISAKYEELQAIYDKYENLLESQE